MENSKKYSKKREVKRMPKVMVLRWGHRPHRDARLTTHVALAARAFGASGFILSDIEDENIWATVEKVTRNWGDGFLFEMGTPWKKVVKNWKTKDGIVVHLTAYGENIQTSDVLQRIKESGKEILVIVGSQKVPGEFFLKDFSDFNVAIGNQPHSECASLAVFLDRLFEGEELKRNFEHAKMRIIPQKRGKKIVQDLKFKFCR
jgi:tRNA (cytidine56-2'-O)-methyltransferase